MLSALSNDQLGKAFALLTAVTWALAVVLFKRSTDRVSPLALNLFKNTVGLILLSLTLVVIGAGFDTLRDYPIEDVFILAISGVIGIALADTLFFRALHMVGVGILAVVDCTYSPFVIIFSLLILPEYLSFSLVIGGVLVLGGILISSRHAPPPGQTRGQLIGGVLIGVLAMLATGAGIVVTKLVLEGDGYPIIWATTIRLAAGGIALAVIVVASPDRAKQYSIFLPSAAWKDCIPASIFGTYLAMIFWIAGFKFTSASSASILNQVSVVFQIIFAWLILKEHITRRKMISFALAFCGMLIIVTNALEGAWNWIYAAI